MDREKKTSVAMASDKMRKKFDSVSQSVIVSPVFVVAFVRDHSRIIVLKTERLYRQSPWGCSQGYFLGYLFSDSGNGRTSISRNRPL